MVSERADVIQTQSKVFACHLTEVASGCEKPYSLSYALFQEENQSCTLCILLPSTLTRQEKYLKVLRNSLSRVILHHYHALSGNGVRR